MELDPKVIEKFWAKVDKTNTCWLWRGTLNKRGAPVIKLNARKEYSARRISLLIAGVELSPKELVYPRVCDNKLCVNPNHLVVGDEARFYNKVIKWGEANGGCWVWTGLHDKNGYGRFRLFEGGKKIDIRAHVYSWQLTNNHKVRTDIGMMVMHKCDHPYCVNPDHLSLGTQKDNMSDMRSKGREPDFLGEKNPSSKLTADDVREIRRLRQTGMTQPQLAAQFKVIQQTISSILNYKIWKHIT
jgi:hypothetical protein